MDKIDDRNSAKEQPIAPRWLLANNILIDGDLLAMSLLPHHSTSLSKRKDSRFWLQFAQTVCFAFINHNPSSP
jgi:hypothetical protein